MAQTRSRGHHPDPRDWAEASQAALRLTVWYAAVAALWILLSDQVLGYLGLLSTVVSQAKGVFFIAVTSALLFLLSRNALLTIQTAGMRYRQLFLYAAEGLTLYRIVRDDKGMPVDLVVEDVNEARSAMSPIRGEQVGSAGPRATSGLDPEASHLAALVMQAARTDAPLGAEMHDQRSDRYRRATVYPIDADLWVLALVDITEERRTEKALRGQEEAIREAYMDVLDAVTGGKLVLLTEPELVEQLGEPLSAQVTFDSGAELSKVRARIREEVERRLPGSSMARSLMNPVGEALNNVLKHAGAGAFQVFARDDNSIQVAVSDSGPGIDFRSLPKATLVQGYSTTATLGAGFTIMLQMSDRVLLTTRPGRTIVVIECCENTARPTE